MMPRPRSALAALVVIAGAVTSGCTETSTAVATTAADLVSKCQVSLTAPSVVDAGGGTATVAVTTQPECAWNASTTANWISGLSPASGQGSGNLAFRVAANDGTAAREADIRVNEGSVRVSQRAPCRFDLRPVSQTLGASGGGGSVIIAAASDCTWSAMTDASWISLSAPLSGSGNGTISFVIAPNSGPQRSGSVIVAGQRSTVTQSATGSSACSYTIAPTSQTISAAGGAGTPVAVSTQTGCQWTASSSASWITIATGTSGTGNGAVGFVVGANTGGARSGTLTVATQTFTVNQAALAPCSYSISPGSQKVDGSGGTVTVAVTSGSGCPWTASSNDSWITIIAGASGTGNGTVTIRVAANDGKDRKGTLTIAGKTATIEQRGK